MSRLHSARSCTHGAATSASVAGASGRHSAGPSTSPRRATNGVRRPTSGSGPIESHFKRSRSKAVDASVDWCAAAAVDAGGDRPASDSEWRHRLSRAGIRRSRRSGRRWSPRAIADREQARTGLGSRPVIVFPHCHRSSRDPRRAAGGQPAGQERRAGEDERGAEHDRRVEAAVAEEQSANRAACGNDSKNPIARPAIASPSPSRNTMPTTFAAWRRGRGGCRSRACVARRRTP